LKWKRVESKHILVSNVVSALAYQLVFSSLTLFQPMCGIAGILLNRGVPDRTPLAKAAELLAHRGPDDQRIYINDSVGLVHTRLSIIDLAGGHQPIRDKRGHYALVANGEIFNYPELTTELQASGRLFSTRSDSEIPLHIYDQDGAEGFRRLHGMFAFALYSTRNKTLVLARDRLGIKPLYYALLPDRLVFASELKALLPLLPRQPEIDPQALDRFLEIGFNSAPETIFHGVKRLEPGTALTISPSLGTKCTTFWSPLDLTLSTLSPQQAEQELDRQFAQILTEHMRSDVPYGLFLSGGMDSGALLAQLSKRHDTPIRTFSVGYKGVGNDGELSHARQVAKAYGSDHTELRLNLADLFACLPLMVWAADDLMYDPACLPTALMAMRAARELKVVFTGEGGDEVFAGYGRYRKNGIQRVFKRLTDPFGVGYRTRSRWPAELRRHTFPDSFKEIRPHRHTPVHAIWKTAPGHWSFLQRAQLTDLRTELADGLLVKVDRMLMAFGLEGRVPYLDHRLVEFGLSLPDDLKIQGRVGKLILKRWASGILPQGHLERKKRGFGVPLGKVLKGDLLMNLAAGLRANPMIREWFLPDAVSILVSRQEAKGDMAAHLIQLIQLALWYRLLLDGEPAPRPATEVNPLDLL
jgi:asparagine synthase (glutamine-hydrolysing)